MKEKEGRRIPDMLCIGHMCHDRYANGHLLGGTASYASLMSAHLAIDTALLTSVGQDFKFWEELIKDNLMIENVSVDQTTEFENVYDGDKRTQYIHARANVIGVDQVPDNWFDIPTVKLCLIADEVSSEIIQSFPNAFKAASIQGWLRKWDDSGLVYPRPLDLQLLDGLDMIFLSEDDFSHRALPCVKLIKTL